MCPISTFPPCTTRRTNTLTFFAVNRHGGETLDVEIGLQGFGQAKILDCQAMESADLEAVNTLKNPDAVTPKKAALCVP